MKYLLLLLILHFVNSINGDALDSGTDSKKKRSFSIFSVVQFQNNVCFMPVTSASTVPMRGTCFTSSECSNNGGSGSGSCASGFGVCCMFTVSACTSTITKNTTYIQNPGFPSGFTTATTCTYTVSTTSDICQIRLDFDNFVSLNPGSTVAGTVNTPGFCNANDRLTVTSPSGSGINASPPVLCGTLTGSHMYVETGRANPTGATIAIANTGIAGQTPARTWKIRVTLIECGNPSRAPIDCVQYFTGPSGTFNSYNYQNGVSGTGSLLVGQNYHNCFRQEEGYCGIQYSPVDVTGTTIAFALDATMTSAQGATCANAEITIPVNGGISTDSFCGRYLNEIGTQARQGSITSNQTPFLVGVYTTSLTAGLGATAVGFNLNYNQVPC